MADAAEPPPNATVNGGGGDLQSAHIQQMHQKLNQPPRLLSTAAGKPTCSIFRVPQSMIDVNGKCYEPRVVSVGPYHRGQARVRMIEEHKWWYLKALLARTHRTKGLMLEDYLNAVKKVEGDARECYSETIHMESDDFNEMMVLDGCFIVELFRKVGKLVPFEPADPIVSMAWILPFFYRDFLRLENQIPYFVLEVLFNLTRGDGEEETKVSLASLAFEFFNNVMHRQDEGLARFRELRGKHLLDLVRTSLIPESERDGTPRPPRPTPSHIIHSISKLRHAGIRLREVRPENGDSFLLVHFKHGVIEMPTVTIDDFMSSLLQNCVAYEQCHSACSKHFTTYATLLDCLINTYKDVEYLCERNIIENYFGTEGEVASFVNKLGKDVAFDIDLCYLSKLFNDVNEYYKSSWHVQWASFKYTYFSSPWSFISALAALVLLVLSVLQTFYTIYQVYK